MAYATIEQVEAGFRQLTADERAKCGALLDEADILIDSYNKNADSANKKVVECRMVRRAIGDGDPGVPMGASQGSMSALGYSQSWTMGSGSSGELYIGRTEKKILGYGERIGARSPLEDLCAE